MGTIRRGFQLSTGILLLTLMLLGGCGTPPEEQAFEAFMASREALEAGDVAALKSHLVAEKAAELDAPEAEMLLEIAQSMMPQDIRLVSAEFGEEKGTLTLAGRNIMEDGEVKLAIPADGTVRMVLEDGSWKVGEEEWAMQLDKAVPIFDVQPFMEEGQRPVALKVLQGHADGATEILHTPDWRFLITTSYGDFSVRTWDVAAEQEVAAVTLEGRPTSLTLGPDAQTVYAGTAKGDVFRLTIDSFGALGEPELVLEDAGQHVSMNRDATRLAGTSHETPVIVRDLTGEEADRVLEGSETLRSTTFSPDGDLLAGSEGNELVLWDTKSWKQKTYTLGDVSPDSSNYPITFSKDGRYLGVPCGDSSILIFDVQKRRVLHDFFVSGAAARTLQFSPDGSLFATAQNNGQINLWGIEDHKRVGYILSKKVNAEALRFSPDGRYLIAGHEDREIVFWGVAEMGQKSVAVKKPGAGSQTQTSGAKQPKRITLLSKSNYLANPNADQRTQFWRASGDTSVEKCANGDPCFVTRWDGKLVGKAVLPAGATGKYMLLIGSAAAERVHAKDTDQTGESYIHGYGESLDPKVVRGKHYSARTLQTATRQANQWATIWGVFEVGDGIRKISFEIRQSDGSSAKDGSASRFDDLGVFLFDTESEARKFVARYEGEVGHVTASQVAKAQSKPSHQPPASPASRAPEPEAKPSQSGSALVACKVNGRTVFTTKAQCSLSRGR